MQSVRAVMAAVVLVVCCIAYADDRAQPASWSEPGLKDLDSLPAQTLGTVNPEALREADGSGRLNPVSSRPAPLQIAVPFGSGADILRDGLMESLRDGSHVWRMRFEVPGATDIGIAFSRFWLPDGVTVHIYDAGRTFFQGPFDMTQNKRHGGFRSPAIPGDVAIVEVRVPASAGGDPVLQVQRIFAGYRDLFGVEGGPHLRSHDWPCSINVVCPEGDAWRRQIRSAARYTIDGSGGSYLCTGTLVNDVENSLTPHFLTAEHCGTDLADFGAPTMVFYWNYQASTCSGSTGSQGQSQSGATTLASRADVDMWLVLLDDDPNTGWNVHFAGWDRSGHQTGGAVGIHHPAGHIKQINHAGGTLQSTTWAGGAGIICDDDLQLPCTSTVIQSCEDENSGCECFTQYNPNGTNGHVCAEIHAGNTHWAVPGWDEGTTAGGSSGSGLWSSGNGMLIGFLTGGTSYCSGDDPDESNGGPDWYGKFSEAWDGASADSRLKDHLDPDEKEPSIHPGIDHNPDAQASPCQPSD